MDPQNPAEERRRKISINHASSIKAMKKGKLTFSSDVDQLRDLLESQAGMPA